MPPGSSNTSHMDWEATQRFIPSPRISRDSRANDTCLIVSSPEQASPSNPWASNSRTHFTQSKSPATIISSITPSSSFHESVFLFLSNHPQSTFHIRLHSTSDPSLEKNTYIATPIEANTKQMFPRHKNHPRHPSHPLPPRPSNRLCHHPNPSRRWTRRRHFLRRRCHTTAGP